MDEIGPRQRARGLGRRWPLVLHLDAALCPLAGAAACSVSPLHLSITQCTS